MRLTTMKPRASLSFPRTFPPLSSVDAFGMAAEGLALTVAPAYAGLLARSLGLAMRPIAAPEVMRWVCLYHSTSRSVSPAVEGFREHLITWLGEWDDIGGGKRGGIMKLARHLA